MIYNKAYFEGNSVAEPISGGYGSYKAVLNNTQIMKERAIRLVSELVRINSILVVGCAYGALVEELLKLNVNAYGLDISEYAIGQANDEIKPRLYVGSAIDPQVYLDICEIANIEMFSCIVSEHMLCCLSDKEMDIFNTISVLFAYSVIHIVEDRPALSKWYNYKSALELERLYGHPTVTFQIQGLV